MCIKVDFCFVNQLQIRVNDDALVGFSRLLFGRFLWGEEYLSIAASIDQSPGHRQCKHFLPRVVRADHVQGTSSSSCHTEPIVPMGSKCSIVIVVSLGPAVVKHQRAWPFNQKPANVNAGTSDARQSQSSMRFRRINAAKYRVVVLKSVRVEAGAAVVETENCNSSAHTLHLT